MKKDHGKSSTRQKSRKSHARRPPPFLWNCLSAPTRGRPNGFGRIWKLVGSSTMPCSQRAKDDSPDARVSGLAGGSCSSIQPESRTPEGFFRPSRPVPLSEYEFQALAIALRDDWIAEHLDAPLAQILGTRAYHALNRVCVGKARSVRFKSKGRAFPAWKISATIPAAFRPPLARRRPSGICAVEAGYDRGAHRLE